MDINLKKKALKQLAMTESDDVMSTLYNEMNKINEVLCQENDYSIIEEQLEILGSIAFRVYDKAINALVGLLNRIEGIDFKFNDELGIPENELIKYQNSNTLTIKTLEVLKHIRYFDIGTLLNLFFKYSIHIDEGVRKKADECIESTAEYNLDIIYGSEHNQAYGPFAQIEIIKILNGLTKSQRKLFFPSIISICRALLSSTVSGTSSTYKTITWSTAPIQSSKDFSEIRNSAISTLENLYDDTENIGQKLSVINTLYTVIHTPHRGKYSDELVELIYSNLEQVLAFYKKLLESEPLQIIQKIEHYAFWIFRNRSNDSIKDLILQLKEIINLNEEYQIYKILVGFEGIFEDWEITEDSMDYEKEREYRNNKILEYVESVTSENYDEWLKRILLFAGTESDDLATFPYFGTFLEQLGEKSPDLSLRLIADSKGRLERFYTAILIGVWRSNKDAAIELIRGWIEQGNNLSSIAKIFEYNSDLDENLINDIFSKAVETEDEYTIVQIIASVSANYDESNKSIIDVIFRSIRELTKLGNTNWINALWFRKERNKILSNLDDVQIDIILKNLLLIESIDYHAEEILFPIATEHPEKIINFFGERQKYKEINKLSSKYDAIPFDLYELNKPLSEIPEKAVDIVSGWYGNDYGMFIYFGANLLKIIFPDFPEQFEEKLIELVKTGDRRNIDVVMAVLRNYEGEVFLYNICKELIINIPNEEDYISEVRIILDSTGVVSGEYGFANAFTKKQENIKDWLKDENKKVRKFAKEYDKILEKRIEWETKRSDENIELRKHKYGEI